VKQFNILPSVLLMAAFLQSCLLPESSVVGAAERQTDANNQRAADRIGERPAGAGMNDAAAGGCIESRPTGKVPITSIDKVDLLIMVDNTSSMANEQLALQRQLPSFIDMLTTGYRFENDPNPFPPVKSLHVGVVSSDMGIPGVELPPTCRGDGGDDGKLQNIPHGSDCDALYPLWLQFVGDARIGSLTDSMKFTRDVACIAALGTGGCGFQQQLEAPFKALMPRVKIDAVGNVVQNPYRFLATEEVNTWGRGDMPVAVGGNKGFMRNPLTEDGLSLIAILLITDEDDCSVKSTDHLKPNSQLPEDSPLRQEDINLRCYYHKEFLYDLQRRYLKGFRELRPGKEQLVVFAAIAGIPTDLVDADALAKVDFDSDAQREQFYGDILNDVRMQEVVDPSTNPGSGMGRLRPACERTVPGSSNPERAWPARRLTELARLFGKNGLVQSICQDDFSGPMDAIGQLIVKQLTTACAPKVAVP
jgi:hypothetical protein